MAFSDDIENEGAIDTGDDNAGQDNSGAAPVMGAPEDNSGAAPVMGAPSAGGEGGTQPGPDNLQAIANAGKQTPMEGLKQFPGNAKRLVSYLWRADAAPIQSLEQAAQQVDPEGKLSPGDRNLLAIDAINDRGGPQASWPFVQANAGAYNAKQAFARTALMGTPQKPADLRAAIDAANQAQAHVLDGSNVEFAAAPGGVTATVTMHGSSTPQRILLSPAAFARWLDVGGDGQWDKVVEHSAPATLQRLAQENPAREPGRAGNGITKLSQMRPLPKQQPAPAAQEDGADETSNTAQPGYNPQPQRTKAQITGQAQVSEPGAEPAIPGTHDANGHYLGPREEDETGYGAELEARSRKIFPDVGHEGERQQWMAAQEEKELARKNSIDVASEKGQKAKEVAEIAGGWRFKGQEVGANAKVKSSENYSNAKVQQAQTKLQAAIAHEEATNSRSANLVAMKGLNGLIATGQIDKMTPAQKQLFDSLTTGQSQGQTQAAPQKQAPAQGAGDIQAAPPDASQRVVGQKYKSTTGKIGVWTGKGWQVQ